MNEAIRKHAKWARQNGWKVIDDASGYTQFFTPDGVHVARYPATPSNAYRRLLSLEVNLRAHGLPWPPPSKSEQRSQRRKGRSRRMLSWHITAQYADPIPSDLFDLLNDMTDRYDGSAANVPGGSTVSVWLEAASVEQATQEGLEVLDKLLADVEWSMRIGLDVVVEAELFRRNATPNYPDLWSTAEVAQHLGVSRQRVHQLRQDNSSFPPPFLELGLGPLWLSAAIRTFESTWSRKPGRPPTQLVAGPGDMDGPVAAAVLQTPPHMAWADDVDVVDVEKAEHEGSPARRGRR